MKHKTSEHSSESACETGEGRMQAYTILPAVTLFSRDVQI